MYEARQNKEKVIRTIGGGDGLRQRMKQKNGRSLFLTKNVDNSKEKDSKCMQFMLTRSGVNIAIDAILRNDISLDDYDLYEQYLIIERAKDRGIDISKVDETLLNKIALIDSEAEENSDIDHPDTDDAKEYRYDEIGNQMVQLKRNPGPSGPYTIYAAGIRGVTYIRDSVGNIDFKKPDANYTSWTDPVLSKPCDLEKKSPKAGFGKLINGKYVKLDQASRSQHNSVANNIVGRREVHGETWHHLTTKYKMILMRTDVHSKFGHNGGYYFW